MKKILLATTMLTMTAGAAAADGHMTWSASAAAGIASNGTAEGGDANPNGQPDDVFSVYSNVGLELTLAGQTDGGLTFGAAFDLTAGTSYALADDDGFDDNGGAFGMPTIFVAGSFGKLELSDDNFDFYDDATGNGDARYTGTFGAVSVGLVADIDNNTASVSLGYSAGNLALSLNADNSAIEQSNIEATYTMGTIAITAATNQDSESSLKLAYSGANGMSASAQYNTSDESIDIEAGYSANGLSVSADTNSVSNAWTVTGSYDLGGGLSVEAGTNYTQDMMIGAAMSF